VPDNEQDPPPEGGRKPITPSPTAMILALALMGLMGLNLYFDQQPGTYNGLYLTGICAALIAGVLGFDLKFPGRDK
jgi:hypothetical protein